MNLLTGTLRSLTAIALAPFQGLPPVVALVFYSLVMGILAAVAFRYTSNQGALKRVANNITASLLALRLYKDDTVITFKAIGGLLMASLGRLWYSLQPMAILLVPFALIIAQLGMYYEFRPLQPGETSYVSVKLHQDRWDELKDIDLTVPTGVKLLSHNRDAAKREIVWKFVADQPVDGKLSIAVAGEKIEKELKVADPAEKLQFVSPLRAGPIQFSNFWSTLGTWVLYPGEPSFGSSAPIQEFSIRYGNNSTPLLGWDVHWVITVLIVSIIGALLVAPFLKVQF